MKHNNLPTPLTSPLHLSKNPSFSDFPEKKNPITKHLSKLIVLSNILNDINGRDKSIKTIQYFIKILLYYRLVSSKRWTALTTHFSITRQVLCLGNALNDIPALEISVQKRQIIKSLLIINSICNAISDDIYCLYRIGILPKKWGVYSEIVSAHCWFISIINNLNSNYADMCQLEAKGVEGKDLKLSKVNVIKSITDLIFCGCDVFHLSSSQVLQAWTGLISGLLAGYKCMQKS